MLNISNCQGNANQNYNSHYEKKRKKGQKIKNISEDAEKLELFALLVEL